MILFLNITRSDVIPFSGYIVSDAPQIGHDDPMSIIDDWGPQRAEKNPLKLSQLAPSRLSHLAFLFGGVGDGKSCSHGA